MKQEHGTSANSSAMQSGSLPYSGYVQASEHGRIRLYQWDCMELLKQTPDNYYGLCIVDPPYGIGAHGGTVNSAKAFGGRGKSWDTSIPTPEYFAELRRVSVHQIIWGGNYFPLPCSRGWIFWYKHQPVPNLSDGELAWTSFDCVTRCCDYPYTNVMEGSGQRKSSAIHPTQKPIGLYRWLLQNYAKPGWKILDTHGGSFSHAIACDIEGFDLDICELDPDYFAAGKKRFENHLLQPRMFNVEPTPQPKQLTIE